MLTTPSLGRGALGNETMSAFSSPHSSLSVTSSDRLAENESGEVKTVGQSHEPRSHVKTLHNVIEETLEAGHSVLQHLISGRKHEELKRVAGACVVSQLLCMQKSRQARQTWAR